MKIKNIQKVKEYSIKIVGGYIDVTHPNGKRSVLTISEDMLSKYDRHWSINKDIIALIMDMVLYVIPYNPAVLNVLKSEGFKYTKNISVPFTDGDYPTHYKVSWETLQKKIPNFQSN